MACSGALARGFHTAFGAAVAVVFTLLRFRLQWRLVLWSALPGAVAAYAAVFVLQLTAGVPAIPLPTGDNYLTLAGEPFNPTDFKGRPVVVNLWATWCPPCRREMPMMADVAASNDAATFVFVNQGEGREVIDRYLKTENLKLDHVALDSLREFGGHYAVPGLPATLFIGSDGTLQSVHMGEISREALAAGVQKIQ